MALGSTQPLTEMSTRNISWGGKGGWCVGLTTLPSSCADCLEIWEPQPSGTLRACPGLLKGLLYLYLTKWFFKLRYVYRCWYAKHFLLVCSLNKNEIVQKDTI